MFLSGFIDFRINLLAFYRKCCSLLGYDTHYLFYHSVKISDGIKPVILQGKMKWPLIYDIKLKIDSSKG